MTSAFTRRPERHVVRTWRRVFRSVVCSWVLPGCAVALAVGLVQSCPRPAFAAGYPERVIHLIVPWPPGGAADVIARPIAQRLAEDLGQPIIVENRSGATGTIGTAFVAHEQPDGYTLLFATSNEITMSPAVYENLPYDPIKSLAPITTVLTYPNVLVVGPAMKVTSTSELIALAKKRPNQVSFASGGSGSTNRFTMEMFESLAGVEVNHIPYKGGGPALSDVIGGQVDAMFATLPSVLAFVKSDKLKGLLVTSDRRTKLLPDVPSAPEQGVPGLIVSTWSGILAPSNTPEAIITKLNAEIAKVVHAPELTRTLELLGQVSTTKPEEFAALIQRECATWSRIAKQADVKPD